MTMIKNEFLINPDGVEIGIKWPEFVSGTSLFVPCINTIRCVNQMKRAAESRGISLRSAMRIEGGKYGVRFWREK